MGWLCPNCGSENEFDRTECLGCGKQPTSLHRRWEYLASAMIFSRQRREKRTLKGEFKNPRYVTWNLAHYQTLHWIAMILSIVMIIAYLGTGILALKEGSFKWNELHITTRSIKTNSYIREASCTEFSVCLVNVQQTLEQLRHSKTVNGLHFSNKRFTDGINTVPKLMEWKGFPAINRNIQTIGSIQKFGQKYNPFSKMDDQQALRQLSYRIKIQGNSLTDARFAEGVTNLSAFAGKGTVSEEVESELMKRSSALQCSISHIQQKTSIPYNNLETLQRLFYSLWN